MCRYGYDGWRRYDRYDRHWDRPWGGPGAYREGYRDRYRDGSWDRYDPYFEYPYLARYY